MYRGGGVSLQNCTKGGRGGVDGESAGARTQDQRLKRAMLYQLSYALEPHYQVSTIDCSFPGAADPLHGNLRAPICNPVS